eukprot:2145426-Prorocentrum_lima.AAC.1
MTSSLVGSEMCIRDRPGRKPHSASGSPISEYVLEPLRCARLCVHTQSGSPSASSALYGRQVSPGDP